MIDELVKLLSVLDGLTWAALSVVGMIFLYKVVVVGSIYGVIRFTVTKACAVLATEARTKEEQLVLDKRWRQIASKLIVTEHEFDRFTFLSDLDYLVQVIQHHYTNGSKPVDCLDIRKCAEDIKEFASKKNLQQRNR